MCRDRVCVEIESGNPFRVHLGCIQGAFRGAFRSRRVRLRCVLGAFMVRLGNVWGAFRVHTDLKGGI